MRPWQWLIFIFLVTLIPNGTAAEERQNVNAGDPIVSVIELSSVQRAALLAAPKKFMNLPLSDELHRALESGAVDKIKVEQTVQPLSDAEARRIGRDVIATYQGWIYYEPVRQSASRRYHPVVLCVSHDDNPTWMHCQDESWIRLQTAGMKKPLRFGGNLTDSDVEQILRVIDTSGLVGEPQQWISADMVFQIIKYPHAGNRINVYLGDGDGFTETLFLRRADGGFELTTFTCGGEVYGRAINQVAAASATKPVACNMFGPN